MRKIPSEHIKNITSVTVAPIDSKFSGVNTYTTMFLIPAFEAFLSQSLIPIFVNTFINDAGIKHLFKRPLFMLIKVSEGEAKKYSKIHKELSENPYFVYTYSVGRSENYYYYMYVYECPKHFEKDYDRFLEGRYSEFSLPYKTRFNKVVPDMTTGRYVESPLYGAIFKTDSCKKKSEEIIGQPLEPYQEYFGAPDLAIETFRYIKTSNHEFSPTYPAES